MKKKMMIMSLIGLLLIIPIISHALTTLEVPKNVVLSDDGTASWDVVDNTKLYGLYVGIRKDNSVEYEYCILLDDYTTNGSRATTNIASWLGYACDRMGYTSGKVKVSIKLDSYSSDMARYKSSERSEPSNEIEFVLDEPIIVDKGTCGDGVTWTLDDTGLLTISGNGYMTEKPWAGKSLIKEVVINEGVKNIVDDCFNGCDEIQNVSIPDSVKEIGRGAFSSCRNLIKIVFPYGLTSIEQGMFWNCMNLESVTIPNTVTYIGHEVFWYCTKLSSIEMPNSITEIGVMAFQGCKSLKNLVISDQLEVISSYAFCDCENLTSIQIPDSVKVIEESAFQSCSALEEVTMSSNVARIMNNAFYGCSKLNSISIPEGVQRLYSGVFCNCYDLQKITFMGNINYIDEKALKNCYSLSNISILACNKSAISWLKEHKYEDIMKITPHSLVKHNRVEPTINTEGIEDYWECSLCNTLFSDENGEKEIEAPVTIARLTPADLVQAFITRCYSIILGRAPDAGGLQTWYNELTSGRKTASEIIDRFVNSPEYLNKNYNYGDSVDILYQAMLGRSADAAGKANWVKKLESGQTLAHVINGFCFSNEFRGLCDSYGIKAGFVNIPNTDTTAEGKIKAFVQRCYRIILDREADPSGMQTWYEQLSSGKKAAAEIIDRFVNSPEFSGKNYNNSDSVEILYKAMLGRGSDAAGKANWVGKLDAGQPFAVVINGFCVSKEFTGICASYGIKPGSVTITPLSGVAEEEALSMLAYKAKEPITKKSETNPTRVEIINPSDTIDLNIGTAVQAVYINEEKAKEFISRCYQCILGREASDAELDSWIGQMTNGTKTPDQIARGFLFSNEFKDKNVSNEDLVKILYKVYMNRDADPEGLKTWTEKLDTGTSLNDLLNSFSKTNEYKKIAREMAQ